MSRKSKAAEFVQEVWDIQVTGRNVLVTESMKDYAMEKVSKIERLSNRILEVNVIMDIQKLEHRVDIIIKVNNIKIKAHAATDNIYSAIDKAVDKIEAQLRRYKTKLHEHQAKGVKEVDMTVNVYKAPLEQEILDVNDDIEEETQRHMRDQFGHHEVVQTETKPLKTLNLGEAIMKMDLSGDTFLIFRCEEDKKIKVIYRRNDGNYGVIQPES